MTVADLIAELEFMNPDTEVRFASQPNWPFEYSIYDIVEVEVEKRNTDETETVVYLVEGSQIGYLPSEAKDELGW
jgi:hypothetical protein